MKNQPIKRNQENLKNNGKYVFKKTIYIFFNMSTTTHIPSNTQKRLLYDNLMGFYKNKDHLKKMLSIINGESKISLRILDWFVTNFSKKYYTVYEIPKTGKSDETVRFKVYNDYKLKLKAYAKKNFDPFCRWERISIPYDEEHYIETTIGQLNFFKWVIESRIIEYMESNLQDIISDMNTRNNTSKKQSSLDKTKKKREELSISACKCIKKEDVKIVVRFN